MGSSGWGCCDHDVAAPTWLAEHQLARSLQLVLNFPWRDGWAMGGLKALATACCKKWLANNSTTVFQSPCTVFCYAMTNCQRFGFGPAYFCQEMLELSHILLQQPTSQINKHLVVPPLIWGSARSFCLSKKGSFSLVTAASVQAFGGNNWL